MIIIAIISIIIYIVAIVAIYYNINELDKNQKIIFIIVGIIVVLILTTIICSITSSQIKIGNKEQIKITKTTAILIFSPINAIIFLPFVGNTLNKYKEENIDNEKIKKRLILLGVLVIIVMMIELGYIKDFQNGLLASIKK